MPSPRNPARAERKPRPSGRKPEQAHPTGSTTNASDAVDDIELAPDAPPCRVVDAGVEETFPASDPVAVQDAYETANERQERGEEGDRPAHEQEQPRQRSLDWMTDKHDKR
jgi:hypothetical protein